MIILIAFVFKFYINASSVNKFLKSVSEDEFEFSPRNSKKNFFFFFLQHIGNHSNTPTIDLNVNILTMGYWPTYTPMEVNLPNNVCKYNCFSIFCIFMTFYSDSAVHSPVKIKI